MLLEQFACEFALLAITRLYQFTVHAIRDHARPLGMAQDFVCRDAYVRILAHPLDFLTQSGKDEQALVTVGERNLDDVGLILFAASQPTEPGPFQKCETFLLRQLVDHHVGLPFPVTRHAASIRLTNVVVRKKSVMLPILPMILGS